MTDDAVRTRIEVERDGGRTEELAMQEWFVGERAESPVRAVRFAGASEARPAPGVLEALEQAATIVICPSNPVISIGPILAVPGIREVLAARRDRVVGVSPIVGGAPVKGPADRLMAPLGIEVSCVGVARDVPRDLFVARHRRGRRVARVRGRSGRSPGGRRRHDDAQPRDRGDARRADARRSGVTLSVIPVAGIGEVRPGDELAVLIADAARGQGTVLADGDCLVVTQKVVSKAEGRLVPLDPDDLDARRALVESESARIVRRRGDLVISETRHGFVCANAGIDLSNVEEGWAALLPVDSDRSAKHVRDALRARAGVDVAVVVSDTFGRPWRRGLTDVAIGVAGIAAVLDLRDTPDALGRNLKVTEVAIADEIASAADLVMGKSAGIPAAIVRGLGAEWFRDSSVRELIRPTDEDLFR